MRLKTRAKYREVSAEAAQRIPLNHQEDGRPLRRVSEGVSLSLYPSPSPIVSFLIERSIYGAQHLGAVPFSSAESKPVGRARTARGAG